MGSVLSCSVQLPGQLQMEKIRHLPPQALSKTLTLLWEIPAHPQ